MLRIVRIGNPNPSHLSYRITTTKTYVNKYKKNKTVFFNDELFLTKEELIIAQGFQTKINSGYCSLAQNKRKIP